MLKGFIKYFLLLLTFLPAWNLSYSYALKGERMAYDTSTTFCTEHSGSGHEFIYKSANPKKIQLLDQWVDSDNEIDEDECHTFHRNCKKLFTEYLDHILSSQTPIYTGERNAGMANRSQNIYVGRPFRISYCIYRIWLCTDWINATLSCRIYTLSHS